MQKLGLPPLTHRYLLYSNQRCDTAAWFSGIDAEAFIRAGRQRV